MNFSEIHIIGENETFRGSKCGITIDTFSIPLPCVAISNKARRGDALTKTLGIMVLVILILVGAAGAAPFAYVTSLGVDVGTVFVIDTAT
ncbi:MAG: YncE family protein, partial [Methanosarcina sp.]|nr:YncE family protein [Methanosarcina sp.]